MKILFILKKKLDCQLGLGCACFSEFLQNFSERQILCSLCFNIEIAYSNFAFYGAYSKFV